MIDAKRGTTRAKVGKAEEPAAAPRPATGSLKICPSPRPYSVSWSWKLKPTLMLLVGYDDET